MTDALKAGLAERIAAQKVLAVVGTGVSTAATANHPLASWKGLITNGVDRCVGLGLRDARWGEQQKALLEGDLDDLLGVAEQVSRRLGWQKQDPCGGDWNEWLRRTVGSLRVQKPELIEAIRDLGVPIATLNYDDLLEEISRFRPLTWQQVERWPLVLDGKDQKILHLHGHWEAPSSVVLGIRSYDAILDAGRAQHLQKVVATTHSLMFIGCGGTFADPNFSALLAWMRDHLSGFEHRHYLLLRRGEPPAVAEELLRAARIVPVPFGEQHADLLPFVRDLAGKRAEGGRSKGGKKSTAGPALAVHNLPPFNPDFVGREEPLKELHRLLTSAPGPAVLTQAITGLGGIGKTQTALAYCYRHLADHTLVWWLHAETAAKLAADFMTLAAPLGLDPAAADQTKLIAGIRAALQASEGWLLVFDNVEKPVLPRTFLPGTGKGHALITSRRSDWQGVARALPLEVMPEAEALQLLTGGPDSKALPPDELAAAKALASELGHLPLALAQASAYMAETGKSLAGYRKLLQASRPAVLARGTANPDYPASVAKTWQISIKAAKRVCAAARPLLEVLAFFSADPLPMAVLGAEPEALPEELRGELECDEAIAALHRFSLIRAEVGSIAVHRLVQVITRAGLDKATAKARAKAAVRLVSAALPRPAQEHSNWAAFGALLPHALAAAEAAEKLAAGLEAAAWVLNHTALYHYSRAAWTEAEPLVQRAIAIGEKALGPENPEVAQSLNNLANLYRLTGCYAEAERLHQRALTIREKALGPENPEVAQSLNNLANLYRTTGRYAAAKPLYERALAIREKTVGPEIAESLNNLALLYRTTGRYAEAESLFQRALAIREKALDPEHPDLATSLNNLAELYRLTGRYAEAEPRFKRALAIREKALGPEHPDVARSLDNLANFYRLTGRYAEAEPLFKRAFAIGRKTLDPKHRYFATWLNNLALLCQATSRLAKAEPRFKRALAIREKALPPDHLYLAESLNNLAGLYQATGRLAEAEPLYQRAIAIIEKTLPPDHPHQALFRENYADLLDQLGRHAEAAMLRAQIGASRGGSPTAGQHGPGAEA